jgi:hypothetical protein
VGEWIEYTYGKAPLSRIAITSLIVFNGYQKSRALWSANSRVHHLKLHVNGRPFAIIELLDSFNYQTVQLPRIPLTATRTVLRFEIQSVYKGSKYMDVALSELEIEGEGAY